MNTLPFRSLKLPSSHGYFREIPFFSSTSLWLLSICIDLLLLILRCFPVQNLLICRSVSKSWKQIIDSATFKLDHLTHQIPRLLLQNHSFGYYLLDPDFVPIFDTISAPDGIALGSESSHLLAVGTIHGVVCLYDNGDNLFLWNSSIRRHMRIPLPPSGFTASSSFQFVCSRNCCFWMDSCTKEFKIVIFYIDVDDYEDEKGGSVFSSRDHKWREIPKEEMAVFDAHYQTNKQSPQFLSKGVAYWIATDYRDHFGGLVVYYDFEQDKFGKIVLPQDVGNWSLAIQFSSVSSGDSLSIMATTCYPSRHQIGYETWVLRSGSWSKRDRVRPREDLGGVFAMLDWFNMLASNSDGKVALYRELEDDIVPLFSTNDYDTKLNVKHGDKYLFSFTFDFVESLIFPY